MRRLVTARKFRAWVASEARRAGEGADKGLKELKSSWKAESERLKSAETKLTRLREEVKANHMVRSGILSQLNRESWTTISEHPRSTNSKQRLVGSDTSEPLR